MDGSYNRSHCVSMMEWAWSNRRLRPALLRNRIRTLVDDPTGRISGDSSRSDNSLGHCRPTSVITSTPFVCRRSVTDVIYSQPCHVIAAPPIQFDVLKAGRITSVLASTEKFTDAKHTEFSPHYWYFQMLNRRTMTESCDS